MHKGFFYYVFSAIIFPFKLIIKFIVWLWKKFIILMGDIDEVNKDRIKRKNLNKWLVKNRLKDEVV